MTPRNGIRSARFWVWANGSPCKLTLRPEECVSHRERGVSADGTPGTLAACWTLTDAGESVVWWRHARSADGQRCVTQMDWCPTTELRAHTYVNTGRIAPVEEFRVDIPNWRFMRRELRDRFRKRPGIPLRV